MFLQVLKYMKKNLISCKKTRTKNEKNSENIYKNEVSIIGFFRNIEISKKSYDAHFFLYIFSESFSFFVLGAKLRPVVIRPPKKNGFVCERFCAAILFSKKLLKIISCILTLVKKCMQNQISIYLFIFL